MPTVCIDCRYAGPRPSGISEMLKGLIDHAPALAPDLDFLLLTDPLAPGPLSLAANVTERAVYQAANGPISMWFLRQAVDLSGVDLFHAPANTLPAGLSMPCVTTIHDVMWLSNPAWCHRGRFGAIEAGFYRHGMRRALRKSAAITTVSEATRAAILAIAPQSGRRIFTTHSGVSDDFRGGAGAADVQTLPGIRPGRPFVLVVGQNAPYKNHEGALRAFAIAYSKCDAFDLVFVQRRGAGSASLRRLAIELGIGERLVFPESVSREHMIGLYRTAHVLLHPSLCEGFGNPLAEAMACGCPVVTSNVSAMPEVTDGAALLADPRDHQALAACLRRVTGEPGLSAKMRAKGQTRAAQLSWRNFAAGHVAIYRRLLSLS